MVDKELRKGLRLSGFKETKILVYDEFSEKIYKLLLKYYNEARKKLIPIKGKFSLDFNGYIPIGLENVLGAFYLSFFENKPFPKKIVYDNPALFVSYEKLNLKTPILFGKGTEFILKVKERKNKILTASLKSLFDLIDFI